MITEKDIAACDDIGTFRAMCRSLLSLLKERDSALEGKKAAELRAEAYREVAFNYRGKLNEYLQYLEVVDSVYAGIDQEAARIMKEKVQNEY